MVDKHRGGGNTQTILEKNSRIVIGLDITFPKGAKLDITLKLYCAEKIMFNYVSKFRGGGTANPKVNKY